MTDPTTPGRGEKLRTDRQLREHYEVERELADQLRSASKEERRTLYAEVYEELYRRVPHHPQLTRKLSVEQRAQAVEEQMLLLGRLVAPRATYAEIGAGDCSLAFEVARRAKKVWAIEISDTIAATTAAPDNFELVISDGCSIPVRPGSVDVAYSNQLMEHLHPDDAYEQLCNVVAAIAPRGVYLCITPNRLNGPHDISRSFSSEARGFHLKEYTITELSRLFKLAGFSKVLVYLGARGRFVRFPVQLSMIVEAFLGLLPGNLGRSLARTRLIAHLIEIRLLGIK